MQNKPKHRNVEKVEYLILNSVSHPQNETLGGEKSKYLKKCNFRHIPTYNLSQSFKLTSLESTMQTLTATFLSEMFLSVIICFLLSFKGTTFQLIALRLDCIG